MSPGPGPGPSCTMSNLDGEAWRMFRIISEFAEGFEEMSQVEPAVSVFGSARTKPDHPVYQQAVQCGRKLVERGFSVITGGGPGIMEAANRGAFDAKGNVQITAPRVKIKAVLQPGAPDPAAPRAPLAKAPIMAVLGIGRPRQRRAMPVPSTTNRR